MQTSVRYMGDGIRTAWLVPFPYGSVEDFTVLLDEDGESRELVYLDDYQLIEHAVIYELPKNAQLFITLINSLARVNALQEERVKAWRQAGASEAQAMWHAASAAQISRDVCKKAEDDLKAMQDALAASFAASKEALLGNAAELGEQLEAGQNAVIELVKAEVEAAITKMWSEANRALARSGNKGIAPCENIASLLEAPTGFYVINPAFSLAGSPLGIRATDDISQNLEDGFYVNLPECPGHDLMMPDAPNADGLLNPGEPGNSGEPGISGEPGNSGGAGGAGSWWLPCDHTHNQSLGKSNE